LGFILVGLAVENVAIFLVIWSILWSFGLFNDHLVYLMTIWSFLWPFRLVYIFPFGFVALRKIRQPCSALRSFALCYYRPVTTAASEPTPELTTEGLVEDAALLEKMRTALKAIAEGLRTVARPGVDFSSLRLRPKSLRAQFLEPSHPKT
jgi:hypothetical protein